MVSDETAVLDARDGVQSALASDQYETLRSFATILRESERELIGRDREMQQILAAMERPELSNVLLLAPAGAGKTSLVQGVSQIDTDRIYLEVDLARMLAGLQDANQMASLIKALFDEAGAYSREQGQELVLFIDEFHQIVQMSPAGVEALKPALAASGTLGLRIIAATTYDEFHQYVASNLPLVERLQRINLEPPDKAMTIEILRGMATRYEVAHQFYDDHVFNLIYDLTERYVPESAQPRKSLLILDAMVGWHRLSGRRMDRSLVADVLMESKNVNVAFNVDAAAVEATLNKRVISQEMATSLVARRLQLCVAGLNDPSRPMASFLFTGATGTGKTELTKQLAEILFGDSRNHLVRFDMSEYAEATSLERFRRELTESMWNMSHCVLLVDEIEKADKSITRLLLQVLDDGRLIDVNEREVSFKNSYVVMTTNAGSEIYKTIAQWAVDDRGSGSIMTEFGKIIRRSLTNTSESFPVELLGRIDAVIPFQPLSRSTQRTIATNKLRAMAQDVLDSHGVRVLIDRRVLTYLVDDRADTDTEAGGARRLVADLANEVTTEIAIFLNKNPGVAGVRVAIDGELVSENKFRRTSTARVVVREDLD